MKEFLKMYIKPKTGRILTLDGGQVGNHDGAYYYTIGQRLGPRFGIDVERGNGAQKKWYVASKNPKTNTIVAAPEGHKLNFRKEIISDRQIWDLHMTKKKELVETVIQRTGFGYDPERLVITWARRLAEYKQPKIIFTDLERLKKIVENSTMPVQLLFAGNTHSADPNAKSIIEEIIKIFSTELSGHAIFVPNYNVSLANHLTSGSDIWLNTPQGNLEACGTSGMKAISNGVLNCTVLDGWTYEVDWEGAGWVLDPKNVAENLYDLLEKEITPLFYTRNADGLPDKWIGRMRESITIAKKFGAERMLEDYKKYLYT